MFDTQYTRDTSGIFTSAGSGVEPVYSLVFDDNGVELVQKTGERDVYSEIQSYRESTELSVLLSRYAQGDTAALNQKVGSFFDAVDMPKTYAELFQRARDAEIRFSQLPADLKSLFNGSYTEFWSQMGTSEFNDKLNRYIGMKNSSGSGSGVGDSVNTSEEKKAE